MSAYKDFQERFKLLVSKNRHLIVNTLSNIFSMRIIGNKTHGDLAEIGMVEFVKQFMYDFNSLHVGKDLFRKKEHEEDILVINELTKEEFPISLKAYGDGPLQLSTDSEQRMFPFLKLNGKCISDPIHIQQIFNSPEMQDFGKINIMPLIYNENKKQCNIMIFDYQKAKDNTNKIIYINQGETYDYDSQTVLERGGRKHPIYLFLDKKGSYLCEVRYGGASANALQRGLWTHTKNALTYFDSLTNGWINYSHNEVLVKLFSLALNSTQEGHKIANEILQANIDKLKTL